jgi:predicted GIY-YIG superfamily endonuclease
MEYTFYKLQIGDKCYVGSTIDFKHRMKLHKHNCYNENVKNIIIKCINI